MHLSRLATKTNPAKQSSKAHDAKQSNDPPGSWGLPSNKVAEINSQNKWTNFVNFRGSFTVSAQVNLGLGSNLYLSLIEPSRPCRQNGVRFQVHAME